MFGSIRNPLILIVLLVVGSIYFLFPATVTVRERGPDGVMHDDTVTRVPLKPGLDLQGGMHLALELDQSKQVSADPKRDIELALRCCGSASTSSASTEPLVQKAGDDRIVVELAGHHRPGARQGHRPAERLPRVPDHRQDRRAREGAARRWTARSAASGVRRASRRPRRDKPSAVQQLLGRRLRKRQGRAPDTRPPIDRRGVLERADPAGRRGGHPATPGEYVVPETAFPRVDSLLNLPAGQARSGPADVEFLWSGQPTSVGVEPVPAALRAGRPADHHRAATWWTPRAAARPADQRADRHASSSTAPAGASSATRPAGTSATSWRSCSTAGCRAVRR